MITKFLRKTVLSFPEIDWKVNKYNNSYLVLKWGENQYKPNSKVLSSISNKLSSINKYPSLLDTLKEKVCNYSGIVPSKCLICGADRAFRIISETFIDKNDELIIFQPTFPIFEKCVQLMGGRVKRLALNRKFQLPPVQVISKSLTSKTKIIYICNPNNPTGNFVATNKRIEQILELGVVVVVDEVYSEFSNQTCINLLKKYNNLIIIRSFSKTFGLAGLRVGYILSSG
ncbi:MAG: aminotransferase class I/II-fold pyridoxal phosphate-dependent enzyme, partial [Candidatus Dojkabacteria bacterium]|nr:aminotransferase class I/II-fold pyridoxal phosphate-dependent enzyme [Candidatus Dojkabacteria bacterium]